MNICIAKDGIDWIRAITIAIKARDKNTTKKF